MPRKKKSVAAALLTESTSVGGEASTSRGGRRHVRARASRHVAPCGSDAFQTSPDVKSPSVSAAADFPHRLSSTTAAAADSPRTGSEGPAPAHQEYPLESVAPTTPKQGLPSGAAGFPSSATAAADENALRIFPGETSASSPSCRGKDEGSRHDCDTPQGGGDALGCGAGEGRGCRSNDGGEGEGLPLIPDTSPSMPLPTASRTKGKTSLASLRMRNLDALHAHSWDRRIFLPQGDGITGTIFELLASSRIWEKVDFALRGSAIAILPTLIVCLEPATAHIFPIPTSVVFLAYWTTQPTLGAGLRETFTVLKSFIISLAFLSAVVAIQPGPKWLTILILFFSLSVAAFVAQQMRVMIAYCLASLLMQYVAHPETTDYKYIGDFYLTLFIGQGFAVGALMFPFIRWSSENARRYLVVMGDAISLSVHGGCCSFWVEGSLLERQLHVARLRQLRQTIEASMEKAQQGLSEMGYEPHTGVYTTRLKTRMAFLKNVFNIVQSMTLVVEQIAANPTLIETPTCRTFGERIRGEVRAAAAAMDAMLLRIVDLDNLVCATDMEAFRAAKARYEDAVASVRDEVVLSNENYRVDSSDILLGFFLFSVEELMGVIGSFQDAEHSPSNLWYFLTFFLRDLQSLWSAFVELRSAVMLRHSITRRLKEGIKLSLCIALAAWLQTYAIRSSVMNSIVGVDTIAFLYRSTRGESVQYGQYRLLGTVLGCLTGLLGVRIANGRRPVLYACTFVLTFIGSYVQASPECGPIGNGMSNGVISVVLEYENKNGAIVRIEQNCTAIIIYFIVTSLVWPVRCQTKVRTGFDGCMRMGREVTDRLLRNLDLPHSATDVSSDVTALLGEMQKKVNQQLRSLTGARLEPTMDSAEFPDMAWRMLLSAQRKLVVTLLMMRHAYATFMSSTFSEESAGGSKGQGDASGGAAAAATNISVHWVVLHRISPYTRQLSLLLYEAMEVYLLLMSKVTFVPTSDLTRLRLGMMQCYDRIVAVYIETLQQELCEGDGADGGDNAAGGDDVGGARGRRAESTGQGGLCMPIFTPSGLMVDAGVQKGEGVADSAVDAKSYPDLFPRRTNRKPSKLINSQRKQCANGGGRISYKLTPEERQCLRDYVLCQQAEGTLNASFLPSVTAMTEHRDAHWPCGALGNGSCGASFINNSIFSLNGHSFCRNASMWDAARLQSCRILVQAPSHEEGVGKLCGRTASTGFLTRHSTLHSSQRSGLRGLCPSVVGADDAVVEDSQGAGVAAVALPAGALSTSLSLENEAQLGGAVSVMPSRDHSSASDTSLDRVGLRQRRRQPRRAGSLVAESHPSILPAADAAGAGDAISNAVEVASLHSVVPHYTVVPTSSAVVARPRSAPGAAATTHDARSDSQSRWSHGGADVAEEAVPNHSILLRSSMFLAPPASDTGIACGDVFSLGRRARAGLWPPPGLMGSSLLADRHHGAGVGSTADAGVPARGLEWSCLQHSGDCTAEALACGVRDASVSPTPATATATLHDRVELVEGRKRPVDSRGYRLDATAAGHVRAKEQCGAAFLGAANDEEDRRGACGAVGTFPIRRGHDPSDAKNTAAFCATPPLLPAAFPNPIAAAAAMAGERAVGDGASPPTTSAVANGSFNGLGPAIPAALRTYVEGLAAFQQQQAPPPPALLGNTSFVTLSSNLPVMGRSHLGGAAADLERSGVDCATHPSPQDAVASALPVGGAPAASASVFAGAAPALGDGSIWSPEGTGLRGTGANNTTGNGGDLFRSFGGAEILNTTLLRLLQPDDDVCGEGNEGGYVLTNSDIHSVEAFLFGLRALITQVEEIERCLLEVVHGMEMAKKL